MPHRGNGKRIALLLRPYRLDHANNSNDCRFWFVRITVENRQGLQSVFVGTFRNLITIADMEIDGSLLAIQLIVENGLGCLAFDPVWCVRVLFVVLNRCDTHQLSFLSKSR